MSITVAGRDFVKTLPLKTLQPSVCLLICRFCMIKNKCLYINLISFKYEKIYDFTSSC